MAGPGEDHGQTGHPSSLARLVHLPGISERDGLARRLRRRPADGTETELRRGLEWVGGWVVR